MAQYNAKYQDFKLWDAVEKTVVFEQAEQENSLIDYKTKTYTCQRVLKKPEKC